MNTAHFNVFSQKLGVDLDGITHHYSFEDASVLHDKIGVIDGVIEGSPTLDTAGQVNNCYSFDGVNDSVNFNSNLGITSYPFSIKIWTYNLVGDSPKYLLSGNVLGNHIGVGIVTTGGKIDVRFGNNLGGGLSHLRQYQTDNPVLLIGWNCIVINVMSFTSIEIYANNIIEPHSHVGGTATFMDLYSAKYNLLKVNSIFFNGKADELSIFNKKLENPQRTEIYNQENNGNSII